MSNETLIVIVVIVFGGLVLAYLQRRSLNEAIFEILSNPTLVENAEKVVEAQPQPTQELIAVIQRQFTLIETLVKSAGLLETAPGKILDKLEDDLREITDADEKKDVAG